MLNFWLISNDHLTEIYCGSIPPEVMSDNSRWSMRSRAYETEQELMEGEKILNSPCKCCGRIVSAAWSADVATQIVEKNICFDCNIWDERSKRIEENVCIYDGEWYTLGPEEGKGFRGFGGSPFEFLKDGRVLRSTNVWYGGVIPPVWRNKIKDNSIFLK